MKTSISLTLILAGSLLLNVPSFAAIIYVRDGGTGNGSAWNNALDQLPTSAQHARGDTIYVASGLYQAWTFNEPTLSTTVVAVKKATVADHGTNTGWSDSYATGQAVISHAGTPLTIDTPYLVIDGQTGSGNSGHGFKFVNTSTTAATRGVLVRADNVQLYRCEITSTQPQNCATSASQDGVYANARQNLLLEDCYIHTWKRCGIVFIGSGLTVDGCYFWHTYSHSDAHGQAIQLGGGPVSGADIRNCVFKDCHGTGFVVALDNTHSNIRVYNNLFWATETTTVISGGSIGTSQCFGTTNGDTGNDCTFHGNTLVNLDIWQPGRAVPGALDFNGAGTGNVASNNVFYNSTTGFDTITGSYNWFYSSGTFSQTGQQNGSGDPFVNLAGGNFALAAATTAGTTLASPYDNDLAGIVRGADGTWDRGAYEYDASGGADVTAPTITITTPTSLGSYSTSSSTVALAGTAGDNVAVSSVTWSNDRGGSGTATGTTSWSVASITLQPGVNVLTATATDSSSNTHPATLTVTYSPPVTPSAIINPSQIQILEFAK